jgi:hypothetical protein
MVLARCADERYLNSYTTPAEEDLGKGVDHDGDVVHALDCHGVECKPAVWWRVSIRPLRGLLNQRLLPPVEERAARIETSEDGYV